MIEQKTQTQVTVLEDVNGINVMWTDVIVDSATGKELARSNRADAFSKNERTRFLTALADNANAVTYADLAGLIDPEPIAPTEEVTEPAA